MQNYEIRIWGNTDKFQELTEAKPSAGLLTPKDVGRLGFKRLQAWNAQTFYSVFFGQNSYMLCCHFLVGHKTGIKLNHRMTTLAVIVRRGFRLVEALSNLKRTYFLYQNFIEKNTIPDNKAFQTTLLKRVDVWEKELADKIVKDPEQMLVNREEYENRGYVSYMLEEQLANYLEEPLRIDFKGACQIMFLHNMFVQKFSSVLFDQKFAAVQSTPKYQKKYALYFPDYNPHQPIMLISSLDEFFTHTFERPGYKSIPLSGRFIDHMDDWIITESADKTYYSIGLMFEPDEARNGNSPKWVKWIWYIVFFALGLLIGYSLGNAESHRISNDIEYNK